MTLKTHTEREYLSRSVYYHTHTAARDNVIDNTWDAVRSAVATSVYRSFGSLVWSANFNNKSDSVYSFTDNLIKSYDT
jgi:hypothetical protein